MDNGSFDGGSDGRESLFPPTEVCRGKLLGIVLVGDAVPDSIPWAENYHFSSHFLGEYVWFTFSIRIKAENKPSILGRVCQSQSILWGGVNVQC